MVQEDVRCDKMRVRSESLKIRLRSEERSKKENDFNPYSMI